MADKHGDPIDFLAEGYKRAIDEVRGPIAKKRIFGPKTGPVAGKQPAERPLKIDPKVPNRRYRRGLQIIGTFPS